MEEVIKSYWTILEVQVTKHTKIVQLMDCSVEFVKKLASGNRGVAFFFKKSDLEISPQQSLSAHFTHASDHGIRELN